MDSWNILWIKKREKKEMAKFQRRFSTFSDLNLFSSVVDFSPLNLIALSSLSALKRKK